ncbi:TA system VapC family ribonuclease toxin [Bythopirellula polymerisocia]|uniref:Ribonuclease VapC41 n=1 Tax=Bythopirellula polymerisocia TaxID=2528003 RepID=A0A5C6CVL4_9BACT|nr:TA system VapC family ribonuclease toxin [Bythopirellula polymerisocia]TWU28592.1 Ribonuclease VapC41 [Bythopirellula polymerisocia]
MHLPYVNLWLALIFDTHFHHSSAKEWFDNVAAGTCNFCRMTQQGFFRLVTNPSVLNDETLTLREAWDTWDRMLSDPRIGFVGEPENIESQWRNFTERDSFSNKVWSDAYLAALAKAADMELVTFDRSFAQYEGLNCNILS